MKNDKKIDKNLIGILILVIISILFLNSGIVDGGSPAHLSVVGEHQIIEVTGKISSFSSDLIDGDSFVMAFTDSSDLFQGKFLINNVDGTSEVAEVTFNDGSTSSPIVKMIDADSFVISFGDHTDLDKGKFVVYNIDGSLELGETQFGVYPSDLSTVKIDNDSFVNCYGSKSCGVWNIDGTEETAPFKIDVGVGDISVDMVDLDSFVVVYSKSTFGAYKTGFSIWNIDGTNEMSEVIVGSGRSNNVDVKMIDADSFVITYRDDVSGDGVFVIYNIDGTEEGQRRVTIFDSDNVFYNKVVKINNSSFAIFYSDVVDDYAGKIKAYDLNGIQIMDELEFSSKATNMSSSRDNFGNINIVFYGAETVESIYYKMNNWLRGLV